MHYMKKITSTSSLVITLILVFFFPPETARAESIALAGCSQTRSWVGDGGRAGYEDITGENLFTYAGTFGGGSIDKWSNGSSYMTDFRNATNGTEEIILLQVCVFANIGTTYGDLVALIELLKVEVPGAPVYLQPLDVSPQSSPSCKIAGYDESVQFIQEAVTNGIALQGPWMLPLYSAVETVDGCHPNNRGAARMVETIQAWLDDINLGARVQLLSHEQSVIQHQLPILQSKWSMIQ